MQQKEKELSDKAEEFAREVSKFQFETSKKIDQLLRDNADYVYAQWERNYKLAVGMAEALRQANANPLGAVGGGAGAGGYEPLKAFLSRNESFGGAYDAVYPNKRVPMILKNTIGSLMDRQANGLGAIGRYQFTRPTLIDLMGGRFGPTGLTKDDTFSPANQEKLFDTFISSILDPFMRGAETVEEALNKVTRRWEGVRPGEKDELRQILLDMKAARTGGGGGGVGLPNQVIEYLTGDPNSPNYDEPHSGDNYHDHLAFVSKEARDIAMAALGAAGIVVGSIDRPGDPGYHGSQQAFDVPGSQVPVGQEPALSARVRSVVAQAFGGAAGIPGANLGPLNLPTAAEVAGPAPRAGAQPSLGAVPMPGAVDLSQYKERNIALTEQEIELERKLNQQFIERQRIEESGAKTAISEATTEAIKGLLQPLRNQNKELGNQAAYLREYSELLQQGVLPAEAEQIANTRKLVSVQEQLLDQQLAKIDAAIKIYEQQKLENAGNAEALKILQAKIDLLKQERKVLDETARPEIRKLGGEAEGSIREQESPQARRQRAVDQYSASRNERESETRPFEKYMEAKAGLEDLIDPLNQVTSVTNALGSAFGDAFTSIISGSESADEALKKMFANIGSYFLDMAAQILAQQALTSILGLLGGGAGGGGSFLTGGLFNTPFSFSGGGYTGDAPRVGGVDGRGGFPAILHPQETVIDHFQVARDAISSVDYDSDDGVSEDEAVAESRAAVERSSLVTIQSAMTQAREALMQSNNTLHERVIEAERAAAANATMEPISVSIDAFDPARAGLTTVEQARAIAQNVSAQTQAQMLQRMRADPSFRRRQGM